MDKINALKNNILIKFNIGFLSYKHRNKEEKRNKKRNVYMLFAVSAFTTLPYAGHFSCVWHDDINNATAKTRLKIMLTRFICLILIIYNLNSFLLCKDKKNGVKIQFNEQNYVNY
jgi:hypothetical protein